MTNLDPSKRAREALRDHAADLVETASHHGSHALVCQDKIDGLRDAVRDYDALAPMTPLVLDREAVKQSAFATWSNATLADQCRMQAREQLDPEFSAFMEEIAERLSIIALTSQAGGLVEDVARLIEALEPFAEQATIAEVMTGFAPHEWAGATPERRIEMIGDRKRKHDNNIVRARSVLSAIRASNPSVGGGV